MEVIEKEKETVKEVPANYWCDRYCGDGYGYGYGRYGRYGAYGTPFASKGVAGAGLGLGIAGTALGLLALSRHGGIGLFGNNAPENVNINANMGAGGHGTAPTAATPADVYIALNAQYHDYCDLFKAWFGDNIDSKIVESAVNFWFKDNDYKGSNKVHDYFKEA